MKKGLVVLAVTLGLLVGGFAFYLLDHYWGYGGCGGQMMGYQKQVKCCQ